MSVLALPVSAGTSHTRAVVSSLAETSRRPLGENDRAVIPPRWAFTRQISFCAATSQSRIASWRFGKRWSMPTAVARILPSGENAIALCWLSGPASRPSSRPEATSSRKIRPSRVLLAAMVAPPGEYTSRAPIVLKPVFGPLLGSDISRVSSGGDVPDPNPVTGDRGHRLAIGSEPQCLDDRVADPRLGHARAMLARRRVPENHAAMPRRGERFAVGREACA